jgi:hypothetical protein
MFSFPLFALALPIALILSPGAHAENLSKADATRHYLAQLRAFNRVVTSRSVTREAKEAELARLLDYADREIAHQTGGSGVTYFALTGTVAAARQLGAIGDLTGALEAINTAANAVIGGVK